MVNIFLLRVQGNAVFVIYNHTKKEGKYNIQTLKRQGI